MAAVTAPSGPRGSLLGRIVSGLHARSEARKGRPSHAAAFIADNIGTVAALGFADAAAWIHGDTYGLIATAVCILICDFKVRD